jgi:hypothetical protein
MLIEAGYDIAFDCPAQTPMLFHSASISLVTWAATERMEVLARQAIDPAAPPHPFTQDGRSTFDALLQSSPDAFAGKLLVCDTTIFSSTAGGVDNLRQLWSNLVLRSRRP